MAVREILDDEATWRQMIGHRADDQTVREILSTWRCMLWHWQRDWLQQAVQRIEFDQASSDMHVTFDEDAVARLVTALRGPDCPPC